MSGPGHEHDDFNFTGGVRELPGKLPDGERILWQGAPRWTSLFRRAFHGRTIAIYFALLIGSRGVAVMLDGGTLGNALTAMSYLLPLAVAGLGLMALIAWLMARASWYTITNRRVLMRAGVVLEITFNFPYSVVDSAGLRVHAEGTGDISLRFTDDNSIAYSHLWPHVRPWRFRHTEPMLRSVAEPQKVAMLLSQAIAQATGGVALPVVSVEPTRAMPMSGVVAASR
ncbi:photosynthetic complex putative assembly protein PuhB [Nevskia sp.]|uniref:photosynthetic complex putative assembly protein PuhB n=1 Tax=Nevskia sp. TaxID=1929292 RepID=UPI0025EB24D2|nr:photosynthetic complex putative assembly protein PuhB [Nevskia sp.]